MAASLHLRPVATAMMERRLKTTRAGTPIPRTWRTEILRPNTSLRARVGGWTAVTVMLVTLTPVIGLRRTEMVWATRMVWAMLVAVLQWSGRTAITIALGLMLRCIHRSTIAIALRLSLRLTRNLGATGIVAIPIVTMRRIGRTTIAIALRFTAWTFSSPLPRTFLFHLCTTLRLVCFFCTRRTVLAMFAFMRLTALWLPTLKIARRSPLRAALQCRRGVGPPRCFSGGLVRRAVFLGLERDEAKRDSAAQPDEWVRSGFHESTWLG